MQNMEIDTYGNSNAVAEDINTQNGWEQFKTGAKDAWYTMTGQTEKISLPAYMYQGGDITPANEKAREETKSAQEQIQEEEKNEAQKLEEQIKALEQKEKEEREHAEMREDTAYQRAIEDMRKAGWNTDGMTPQASPSVARLDSTRSENKKDRNLELKKLYEELEQAVRENRKDRVLEIATSIIRLGGTLTGASLIRKK